MVEDTINPTPEYEISTRILPSKAVIGLVNHLSPVPEIAEAIKICAGVAGPSQIPGSSLDTLAQTGLTNRYSRFHQLCAEGKIQASPPSAELTEPKKGLGSFTRVKIAIADFGPIYLPEGFTTSLPVETIKVNLQAWQAVCSTSEDLIRVQSGVTAVLGFAELVKTRPGSDSLARLFPKLVDTARRLERFQNFFQQRARVPKFVVHIRKNQTGQSCWVDPYIRLGLSLPS